MNGFIEHHASTLALLAVGVLLIAILLVRVGLRGRWLPPMVAYIGLGLLLGFVLDRAAGEEVRTVLPGLRLLAEAGLVMLLFKAGLEADLKDLRAQLPNALGIWFWNVVISGLAGYAAARWWLDLDAFSSLFVGVAMTATSVGVSVGLWQDAGRLDSHEGSLLLDLAELDDLSTIVLMAVLVGMAPLLAAGESLIQPEAGVVLLQVVGTLVGFLVLAGVFSVWLEPRLTAFFERHETDHEPVILVVAVGFLIAALAELAGLSLAIGAFLAGLAFSRDNRVARERPVIRGLYDFFSPFFFVGLGLMVELDAFAGVLLPAALLLVAAIGGKLLGVGLPARRRLGGAGALLLAASMVPRSEIAMVVMQRGLQVGVDERAFAAMVVVSAGTVLFGALLVPGLLRRT
ncbi:cation:proton antiporter [Wenzhouxiangella sp. XN79A]|uniref:cation:proton antiporter n=1 Tax=Wenzhouxiangella sp. XN79A TaxID=2724193 RepID=UPI00144ACF28|nr:cation:proton antiporter [Wenzhouxiangella sp. XN79A]NKI36027.1 cation:proton antiporter [Wenzhouxiangella sp. XN79A]